MHTRGDDGGDDKDVGYTLRPDEHHHVTNIQSGADSQSSNGDPNVGYESDDPILKPNSKTVTVQVTYEPSR